MKICYVSDQFESSNSGVGTYARNLIGGVVREGHQVTLITFDPPQEMFPDHLRVIGIPKVLYRHLHQTWIWKSWFFSKTLKRLLASESFEVIHFLDARDALFFEVGTKNSVIGTMNDYYFSEALASPFEMKPFCQDWVKRWGYYKLVHALEKRTLPKLTHVIACCDAVRNSVEKRYRLRPERITNVYYGIPQDNKLPDAEIENPTIFFTGGNVQRKGLPLLLKSARLVISQVPDLQIRVAGANPIIRKIETAVRRDTVLRGCVHFLGQIPNEEVKGWLRKSSLYAMPSLMEGFAISFLEAMRAGVPVIGGDVGGTRELIKDGENGFLVNPMDEKELATKIIRLLSDKELYERFRRNGFETARQYTVERMARETLTVYECVLKEKVALGS